MTVRWTVRAEGRPSRSETNSRLHKIVKEHIVLLFSLVFDMEGNLENLWFSAAFFSAAEHRRLSFEKTKNLRRRGSECPSGEFCFFIMEKAAIAAW